MGINAQTNNPDNNNEYNTPLWRRFIDMEFKFTDGIGSGEKYKKETDFVLDKAGFREFLKPGDKVLDICSGDAEHARILAAETKAHVEARDFSDKLVAQAQRKTRELIEKTGIELNVNAAEGDMGNIKASINPGEKFKAITVFGSSFLYLPTHEAHEQALKDYCDVLEDGGRLVIQWYEKDPERAKAITDNSDEWLKEQNMTFKRYPKENQPVDPMQPKPNRRIVTELKDLERGDIVCTTVQEGLDDTTFVPYPDIKDANGKPIEITVTNWARKYIHPDGTMEPTREMTRTTNYMGKEYFPVLERMLKLAGFKTVKLVPGPDESIMYTSLDGKRKFYASEPDVFFSEKGQRKLYAIVAEK